MRLVRWAGPFVAVLAPIAAALRGVALPLTSRAAAEPETGPHPAEPTPEPDEREALLDALDLGDRQVEEVMMHRRDIEMIDAEVTEFFPSRRAEPSGVPV